MFMLFLYGDIRVRLLPGWYRWVADYITASNDEDGVAQVISEMILDEI